MQLPPLQRVVAVVPPSPPYMNSEESECRPSLLAWQELAWAPDNAREGGKMTRYPQ